jgi:hypothetical protein
VAAGTGSQNEIRKMLEEMIEAQNAQFGATSRGHPADQVADHIGGTVREPYRAVGHAA